MKTKDIDKEALALLERVFGDIDTIGLPIDLTRVTDQLDMAVMEGSFKDKDIEGAFDRVSKTIYLSDEDGFERKNFTIAHELGHFKLHEDRPLDVFTMHQLERLRDCDVSKSSDDPEAQADYFAMCLLMPKQLIVQLWETVRDPRIISKIFGVPEFIAVCRLRNLKLIK